jgi:toxin ParE1/3/4
VRLIWSERAAADLVQIFRFIAADNPAAARRFTAKLRLRMRAVVELPLSGRLVPEFAVLGLREVFVGRYRLVYRVDAAAIVVITVFEGHRSFEKP